MAEIWPKIFAAFDKNNDGKVDRKELEAAMSKAGRLGDCMKHSDADQDGVITKEEWKKMYDRMIEFKAPDEEAVKYGEAMLENLKK
uniref:EF-hand domain-containing protein n=1 Tax=Lotharella oceanica TaxID=641309 RepID=A0A7S2TZH9_9EUKA